MVAAGHWRLRLLLLLELVAGRTDAAAAVTLLLLRRRRTRLVLVDGLGHADEDTRTGGLLRLRLTAVAEPGRGVILPHVDAALGRSGQLADVVHGLVAAGVRQFLALLPGQFTLGEVAPLATGGYDHVRGPNLAGRWRLLLLLLAGQAAVVVDHWVLLLLLLLVVRMHWGKTGLVELLLLLHLLLLLLGTHHVDADKVRSAGLGWRAGVGSPHGTRHGQRRRDAKCLDSLLHRGRRRRVSRSATWRHSLLLLLLLLDRNHRR